MDRGDESAGSDGQSGNRTSGSGSPQSDGGASDVSQSEGSESDEELSDTLGSQEDEGDGGATGSASSTAFGGAGDGEFQPPDEGLGAKLTKRRVLAGVGIVLLLLVLLVFLLVPSSLLALVYSPSAEFAAAPVTVADDTVEDHGFVETNRETFVVEEDVVLAGQTRTITTSNHRIEYERAIEVQDEEFDTAIFTALSTPAIEVFGTPFNPLADMTHEELLRQFGDELGGEYSDLSGLEEVGERNGVLAGQETEVTQFVLPVEEDGEAVDLYLYVAAVDSGDDLVIAVGGHPAPFAQERLTVFEMLAAVEHPAE